MKGFFYVFKGPVYESPLQFPYEYYAFSLAYFNLTYVVSQLESIES